MTTIQDVARAANVSKATVSRVINGASVVSPDVAERVRLVMEELGYRPNALARGLARNRSNGIGMVVNELHGPYYGLMLSGVEQVIEAHDMHLIVASGHADALREKAAVEFLLDRRCDGLVLHLDALSDREVERFAAQDAPLVVINRLVPALKDRSVYLDDEVGGRMAVEHLLARGHRRIACVTGRLSLHESRARLDGYRKALADAGLTADPSLVIQGDFTVESGAAAVRKLAASGLNCTAVFAHNDQMAVGILDACRELGVAVPERLSVIGYDDVEMASYVFPKLTTIREPLVEMGRMAAVYLLKQLGKPVKETPTMVFQPEVVVRDSVRDLA